MNILQSYDKHDTDPILLGTPPQKMHHRYDGDDDEGGKPSSPGRGSRPQSSDKKMSSLGMPLGFDPPAGVNNLIEFYFPSM